MPRCCRSPLSVEASQVAAATRGRIAKRDAIAACLRAAVGDEVEIAVAYLSGEIRQGRIGIGYATLSAQRGAPAAEPGLTLLNVDAALGRLAAVSGKGSAAARAALLHELFARATAAEQDFLLRLLLGELRQGALVGVMLDAVAADGVSAARQSLAAYFEFYNARRPHQSHDGRTPDMVYFATLAPLTDAA